MMLYVGLIILWSLQALFFGAAAAAIRESSRTRLIAAFKQMDRNGGFEHYEAHEREYELTASGWHFLALVFFVLTVCDAFAEGSLAAEQYEYHRVAIAIGSSILWLLSIAGAVPLAWARYSGEPYLARVQPVLEIFRWISRPAFVIVNFFDEVIRRLAGVSREPDEDARLFEQEILDVVSQAETTGAVLQTERDMIESVMELDETSVAEIMTPRTDVVGVEIGAAYDAARELAVSAGHSRIPVFIETLDKIAGILYTKDLLRVADPVSFRLERMMRPAIFVPETKDVNALLRQFQTEHVHIAIVLDEYGGTAGLVTIEDILEELVGEITDEHDELPGPPPIHRIDDSTVEIDARLHVEELNDELDVTIPEDDAYDTVGGFVFSRLGRVPVIGETVAHENVQFQVIDADQRSVKRLRVHVTEPAGQLKNSE